MRWERRARGRVMVLAHPLCLVSRLLVLELVAPRMVLGRLEPSLLLWLVVMVMSVLVMAVLVMAALAVAGRQAEVTILPLSRSLLLPFCRPLRSWQSSSSLLEAFWIALVELRV